MVAAAFVVVGIFGGDVYGVIADDVDYVVAAVGICCVSYVGCVVVLVVVVYVDVVFCC